MEGATGTGVADAVRAGCVLPVDKAAGPTSHDVVARVRRILATRQVGHTGTLDPFATGLLLVCVGPATRLSEYLTGLDKEYRATLRLGTVTDTDDPLGETLASSDEWRGLDEARLRAAFATQVGSLRQLPPLFSAKRVGGERMHRLARRGEAPERAPASVTVHAIRVAEIRLPEVDFEVECGSGTYIRAIARDVGAVLGVGGHLRALRRTRIGPHRVDGAPPLDALADEARLRTALLSPADALRHLQRVRIDAADEGRVANGGSVEAPAGLPAGVPIVLLAAGGGLCAVAERIGDRLQPRKVFG